MQQYLKEITAFVRLADTSAKAIGQCWCSGAVALGTQPFLLGSDRCICLGHTGLSLP